ncbi:MAG TPA: hypothetical protein VFE18_17925 [Phenylobacterium sp.]|uniref:hypothetical protein n=1 Tax=Phenylobacterium sp. TaxID=1871053 RepID=UPI002D4E40DD|nr:hypothetical protein [Phenylobacterium sp.]HZZ70054.1 hypothetical protein [Phenylobacterium sp.]
MRWSWGTGAVLALAVAAPTLAQTPTPLTPQNASALFAEAQVICQRDGGKLWNHSLCGPILLVDPDHNLMIANQADPGGVLKPMGRLFGGPIPDKMIVANTPTDWSGAIWTQLIWPFVPPDTAIRHVMLAHELFHRIQRDVPIPHLGDGSNGHLDTLEGRYLLQLEWRALAKAMAAKTPAARKAAVADALLFRAERYRRFPAAERDEMGLEFNEGVPEYTGVRIGLTTPAERTAYALKDLSSHVADDTFVRSFAYATGPAYGLMLDQADPAWRGKVKDGPPLWRLLRTDLELPAPAPSKAAVAARAKAYDDGTLRAFEVARESARQKRLATYRAALVEGPVLSLPLVKANRQFRPTTLVGLDDLGTVYPTLRLTDAWGALEVTGGSGALLDKGFGRATVSLAGAAASGLKGDGWSLTLNPGWSVKRGPRPGDMTLSQDR